MKRLLFSFVLICILIVYSYFTEKYVIHYCSYLDNTLQKCADELKEEKYSSAKETADELMDSWEKNNILLSVFIGDDSVTEPQKSITNIYCSIYDENYSHCLLSIRECQGYIHEISENNHTNLANVL